MEKGRGEGGTCKKEVWGWGEQEEGEIVWEEEYGEGRGGGVGVMEKGRGKYRKGEMRGGGDGEWGRGRREISKGRSRE